MTIHQVTMSSLSPNVMRLCDSCAKATHILCLDIKTPYTGTLICDILECNNIPTHIFGDSFMARRIKRNLDSPEYTRPSITECKIQKLQLHIEYANKNIKLLKEIDASIERKQNVLWKYECISNPIMDDDLWHDHRTHEKIVDFIRSEYSDDIRDLEETRSKFPNIDQTITEIEAKSRELSDQLLQILNSDK